MRLKPKCTERKTSDDGTPIDLVKRAKITGYGASNKLVTPERAEELRKPLKAKLSSLNIRRVKVWE